MHDILIIDDEPLACSLIQKFLSSRGYRVEYSLSGEDGLKLIEQVPPRLVLLDLGLPGIGGVDLLVEIKHRAPGVAVIVVTALHEELHARQVMKLGAFDYITKPVDLKYLETCIVAALHGS